MIKLVGFCDTCDCGGDHEVMSGLDRDGPNIYGYVERWECCNCHEVTWVYYPSDDPENGSVVSETWYYRVLVGLEGYGG